MDAVPVPFVMRLADRGPLAVPATKSAEREVLRLLRRGGEPRLRELSVRSVRVPESGELLIRIGTAHLFALRRSALDEAAALGLRWAGSLPLAGIDYDAALVVPHRIGAAPRWTRSEVLKEDDQGARPWHLHASAAGAGHMPRWSGVAGSPHGRSGGVPAARRWQGGRPQAWKRGHDGHRLRRPSTEAAVAGPAPIERRLCDAPVGPRRPGIGPPKCLPALACARGRCGVGAGAARSRARRPHPTS